MQQYRAAGLSLALPCWPQCCRSGLAVVFAGGRRPRTCQHSRRNNDCGRERRKRREARHTTNTDDRHAAATPNMRILLAERRQPAGDGLRAGPLAAGLSWTGFAMAPLRSANWRSGTYDAMVLDLGLPGKDGTEVLADARRSGLKLPILVLTARDAVPTALAISMPVPTTAHQNGQSISGWGPPLGRWCAARRRTEDAIEDARLAAVYTASRGAAERWGR